MNISSLNAVAAPVGNDLSKTSVALPIVSTQRLAMDLVEQIHKGMQAGTPENVRDGYQKLRMIKMSALDDALPLAFGLKNSLSLTGLRSDAWVIDRKQIALEMRR